MAQAVRPSARARPTTGLGRAPPLKSSFNAYRDEQETPSIARKDSKEASYKGQSMSEKVCVSSFSLLYLIESMRICSLAGTW